METFNTILVIILITTTFVYLVRIYIESNRWNFDKYDALYYYSKKFFNKQGYEICKIDLVNKNVLNNENNFFSMAIMEEEFLRKIIVMDSQRKKYEMTVNIKRSTLFGTKIKILQKEKYIE